MKKIIGAMLFALLSVGTLTTYAAPKKIGMKRATQIATHRVHGAIKSKELEKENGKWIYSFDIRSGKSRITEVAVDAYSGKILSVKAERAADEAREAKEEKKEKH
jgi:uncharacterized membrane protein YkoI